MQLHRIRPALAGDHAAVERVVHDAYAKYVERMGKPPGPMLDDYRRRIRDGAVWVLEQSDAILAAIVLLPEADHLLLDNIAVAPTAQGKGLGRTLMDFAEAVGGAARPWRDPPLHASDDGREHRHVSAPRL